MKIFASFVSTERNSLDYELCLGIIHLEVATHFFNVHLGQGQRFTTVTLIVTTSSMQIRATNAVEVKKNASMLPEQKCNNQTNLTIIIDQSVPTSIGVLVQLAQSKIRRQFPLHLTIFVGIPFLNTAGFFG